MELHTLLDILGDNVEIELVDKDNVSFFTFKQENVEDYFFIKENHFERIIKEVIAKDNKIVVKLAKYSKFEHEVVKELMDLKIAPRFDYLYSMFFKLEDSDIKDKEELKKYVLTPKCVRNIRYLSKGTYDGYGQMHIVVLNNGEWFEVHKYTWGDRWSICGTPNSSEEEKEHYKQYLQK